MPITPVFQDSDAALSLLDSTTSFADEADSYDDLSMRAMENVPVTPEELDYYEYLIQREHARARRAALKAALPPRRRNRFRDYISGRNVRNAVIASKQDRINSEHLAPAEQRERVIIALESGVLSTSAFLGKDVLQSVGKVQEVLSAEKVLIIGTSSTDDANRQTLDISTNVCKDISIDSVDTVGSLFFDETAVTVDEGEPTKNFLYDESALFSAADDWGAASMDETARMFSAFPVHYTRSQGSYDVTDEGTWSQEVMDQNRDIARVVDIFVRNLAL